MTRNEHPSPDDSRPCDTPSISDAGPSADAASGDSDLDGDTADDAVSQAACDAAGVEGDYEYPDPGPIGTGEYEVQQGECLSSIARRTGFFWKTLWEHPENTELRSVRGDPNVLLPGDRIHIPERTPRMESRLTDQKHTFVLKGQPCRLRLTIMDYDQPRRGQPYRLILDGTLYQGHLDDSGTLDIKIAPNASAGTLYVGTSPLEETLALQLGAIDPSVNVPGVKKRLENLGFDCGGERLFGKRTRIALANFQKKHGLPATGKLDDDTRQKLEEEHFSD